uniref:hypothetical protein n=1 Tax=Candidatus Wunengus sp. YC65 TaxID=3367701 RepID=UPI004029D7CD
MITNFRSVAIPNRNISALELKSISASSFAYKQLSLAWRWHPIAARRCLELAWMDL